MYNQHKPEVHVMTVQILYVDLCNFHTDILTVAFDTGGELEVIFHEERQVCIHFQVKELPFWHSLCFLLC